MKKIEVKSTTWQEQHKELWNMLVPQKNHAETIQGELIRIIGKIEYELLDNGAINWDDDYEKMANSISVYLSKGTPLSEELQNEAISLAKNINRDTGKNDLYRLNELIIKWILLNCKPIKLEGVNYNR